MADDLEYHYVPMDTNAVAEQIGDLVCQYNLVGCIVTDRPMVGNMNYQLMVLERIRLDDLIEQELPSVVETTVEDRLITLAVEYQVDSIAKDNAHWYRLEKNENEC